MCFEGKIWLVVYHEPLKNRESPHLYYSVCKKRGGQEKEEDIFLCSKGKICPTVTHEPLKNRQKSSSFYFPFQVLLNA